MKLILNFVVSVFIVGIAVLTPGDLSSAEKKITLKMGMVDVTRVTRGSLLAKDIARQIDSKRRKFMSEIKREEIALRKLDDELQKKRVLLSPDAFAEESGKFRSKRARLNKMVQARNQELLEFRRVTEIAWNKAMQKAMTGVVKKYGFNLVFRYSPELILVRPDSLDISNFVLDQLNKNISKYSMPKPAAKIGK